MHALQETHPESRGRQYLLARNGVDDGEVSLGANHHKDENAGRVAKRVDELVHLAEEVAEDPAVNKARALANEPPCLARRHRKLGVSRY